MAALPRRRHELEAGSISFASALAKPPGAALEALHKAGIGDCRFWAHISEGEPDPGVVILDTVIGLCGPLELEFEDGSLLLWETLLPELQGLVGAAKAPAARSEKRLSEVSDVQIALDQILLERERIDGQEAREQVRLAVYDRPGAGREWVPKKYRRVSLEIAVDEREVAEAKERGRWAKEVLNLIREARLPFLLATGATSGTAVEQRCCLGLRARSLSKRVRDWRPFRRYLLGCESVPFPTSVDQVLAYLRYGSVKVWRSISTTILKVL